MQSMKVDIVYHAVPGDFSMEFNLGDCCRMRLLTSQSNTKREYVECLARAVSRSKIIIACGSIYGDEGLIYITAKATGKPLTIINNKEFGIVDDHNVKIIEGSLPLVTTSGLFGGIIIESGPQTIIILSENADIRKNILTNLIHPYIEEVSIMDMRGEQPQKPQETPAEAVAEPTEEVAEEAEEVAEAEPTEEPIAEEVEETAEEIPEEKVEFETEEAPPYDMFKGPKEEDLKIIAAKLGEYNMKFAKGGEKAEEPTAAPAEEKKIFSQIDFKIDDTPEKTPAPSEALPKSKSSEREPVFLFENDDSEPESLKINEYFPQTEKEDSFFVTEDDAIPVPLSNAQKKSSKKLKISIIIISCIVALILLALCYFLIFIPYQRGISTADYMYEIFNITPSSDIVR